MVRIGQKGLQYLRTALHLRTTSSATTPAHGPALSETILAALFAGSAALEPSALEHLAMLLLAHTLPTFLYKRSHTAADGIRIL